VTRIRSIAITTAVALLAGCTAPRAQESHRQPNNMMTSESAEPAERPATPHDRQPSSRPATVLLNVPLIRQKPELQYGCEVTSLAMLLQYMGHEVDKMTLARQVRKDAEPLVQKHGDIKQWGDPNEGFVGDMTGKRKGFAVYNKPLENLLRQYVGEKALNLTGQSYEVLLDSVAAKRPVVIWATGDFATPTEWERWQKDGREIVAPFDEHVVLLVGYNPDYAFVNDPLTGIKQRRVPHAALRASWESLGRQAISCKPD